MTRLSDPSPRHISPTCTPRQSVARGEVVLYDTLDMISKAFALNVITVLSEKMGQPKMLSFEIKFLSRACLPKQLDGKACGVLSCLVALHVHEGRRLPPWSHLLYLQWRKFIAHTILSCPHTLLL